MLMGDSGAGKSESIEALKNVGKDIIKDIVVVFDDMGTIHLEDGVPFGQGTELVHSSVWMTWIQVLLIVIWTVLSS